MTTPVRPLARLAVLAGLIMALAAGLGLGGAAPAQAQEEDGAVERLTACMANEQRGDLLILIDTSASLQSSDADAARVQAGRLLLTSLASFAERAGVDLTVNLAGFANRYESPSGDWVQLNPSSQDQVLNRIDEYASRDTGRGTDYWLGLEGARRDLAARKQNRPTNCQSIVFFSDGALDIDKAPDEDSNPIDRPYDPENPLNNDADRQRARDRAAESMCRPGGLADQIRLSPAVILAVGLTSAEAGADNFALMQGVATGQGPNGPCGEVQEPSPGEFTLASDIDSLLWAFNDYAPGGSEGGQQTGDVCEGTVCPEGAHSFVLDASVSGVSILAQADIPADVYLVSPSGLETKLDKGQLGEPNDLDIDGVAVNYTWHTDKTVAINADQNGADSWTGQWQVVFVAPDAPADAESRTSLHVYADIFPRWPDDNRPVIRAEENAELEFTLTNSAGTEIDPTELLGQATLDVSIYGPDGVEQELATGLDKNEMSQPVLLESDDLAPGAYTLQLNLSITTAGTTNQAGEQIPGTELAPQRVDIPFSVQPPLGFPNVTTGQVNFGSVEGPVDLSAVLPVEGPGCVWLGAEPPMRVRAAPEEVTDLRLESPNNSAETCLKIEEGQTAELPLRLVSEQAGNGGVNGDFTVTVAPLEDLSRAHTVTVDYTADLYQPLNQVNFVVALIVALILGPGIPIGLLYLTKFATAKIPDNPLLVTRFLVQVEHGQTLRDGAEVGIREGDFTQMVPITSGGARKLSFGDIDLLAKTGGSPFGMGWVEAVSGSAVGVSSEYPTPHGKEQHARLPLAVHNTWALLRQPGMPADQAMAVVLVAGNSTPEQREELFNDLATKAPNAISNLAGIAPGPSSGGGQDQPFGGPGGSGGPGGGPAPFSDDPFGGGGGGGFSVGPPQQQGPPQQGPPPQQGQPPQQQTGSSGGPFGGSGSPFG
ncbi:vWA domain-containing protein [Parenemella sanctibonifatiensis]|uniref:VWFA domain-containing protein n=1 Tax=Parenemella sanctibonifatiensis TaxID=2016505 RepID=A0A255ELD8_9ACTN|nr:vWA domain-containing protein [Parenemella sanctibonifatiensis]OYN92349.1 hypothetical protein CGZ91_02270 [Parenemella sanctibonifatiensis]